MGGATLPQMSVQAVVMDDMGDLYTDAAQDFQCRNVVCYDTNGSL